MLELSDPAYADSVSEQEAKLIRWEADTRVEGFTVHETLSAALDKTNFVTQRTYGPPGYRPYKQAQFPDGTVGYRHDLWDEALWVGTNDAVTPRFEVITHWLKLDTGRVRGLTEYARIRTSRPDHTLPERYFYHTAEDCRKNPLKTAGADPGLTLRRIAKRVLSNVTGQGEGMSRYMYVKCFAHAPYGVGRFAMDHYHDHHQIQTRLAAYYLSLPFSTFEALLDGDPTAWGTLPKHPDPKTQDVVEDVTSYVLRSLLEDTAANM